ncbi:MAG: autotransporter outer membrane beta-barrel domain-containing protein [Simkania negevensis]|nr:autotransporter outer membrane beta-barrel domain-containing protein [Simkania negevensis]
MKLKQRFLLLGTGCAMLLSNAAFADDSSYGDMSGSQKSDMQKMQKMQGAPSYERGTYREITPNAGPRVVNGADVVISADFIWWRVIQEGTDFAFTGLNTSNVASGAAIPAPQGKGNVESVGKEWAPGFKAALGLNLGHDGWDLIAQYTWLRPSHNSNIKGPGVFAVGTGANSGSPVSFPAGVSGATSAKAKWKLQFNVIDLELGRNFYVSQYLTFRPHIGLKGTWQEQDLKVSSSSNSGFNVAGSSSSNIFTGPVSTHWNTQQYGVGIRGGLDTSWYFVKDWSIYGGLAWTAMWTGYDDATVKSKVNNAGGVSYPFLNISQDRFSVRYIGEFELGLRWEMWFDDDNYHVAFQAGWENQVWIKNALFLNPVAGETYQDLTMQGLTVKFRFDF